MIRFIIVNKMDDTMPIYRCSAYSEGGQKYIFTPNSKGGAGWTPDGIAFRVPLLHPKMEPIYRFHRQNFAGWIFKYTVSAEDRGSDDWKNDGSEFYAFLQPVQGTVPIYQFHIHQSDGYRFHYSSQDKTDEGWIKDGIWFYAYPGDIQ